MSPTDARQPASQEIFGQAARKEERIVSNPDSDDIHSSSSSVGAWDESEPFNLDNPPEWFDRHWVAKAIKELPEWENAWKDGVDHACDFYEHRSWAKFLGDLGRYYSRDVRRFLADVPSRPTVDVEE